MNAQELTVVVNAGGPSARTDRPLVICKVWDAEYPWDVRVEKVSATLTERGHRVHLVARNRDGRALEERLSEATVHRLAPMFAAGSRLDRMAMFPAFFNPFWVRLIRRTVLGAGADVILVRDLPLAPTAIYVGQRLGIPVVLDMAENYPAMIAQSWVRGARRPFDWAVRNPAVVSAVERWVIRRVNHVLVVVEESRDRLIGLGVPPERITVVSNTPSVTRLERRATIASPGDGMLELVYLGLLETARGIGVALDAMRQCRDAGMPVRLSVFGSGRDEMAFRQQAQELDLDALVRFHGHVPYREALEAIGRAHVGLVPHFADESWNTTIPNKLFDYMAAGLPVLASDARPVARIVAATQCGELFRDRDAGELVSAIERLRDPGRRAAASAAGQRAIATTFNWECDGERLVRALETTASRASSRVGAARTA